MLLGFALCNATLVSLQWKELKATTFDPEFSRFIGISPAYGCWCERSKPS